MVNGITHGGPSESALSISPCCAPARFLPLSQLEFNREFPTIFTTIQCYLKDSLQRLETDLDRASRGG